MSVSRILLAAATVASLSSFTMALAADPRPDCGWYNEGGRMVFLGTCPHDTGSTGSDTLPTETAPPPV